MKPQNLDRQALCLGSLIRASTNNGNRPAAHVLPRYMDIKLGTSTTLVLRQLIQKGFVVAADAGGFGVHRPRQTYKPTPAGIEFYQAAAHNPETSQTEQHHGTAKPDPGVNRINKGRTFLDGQSHPEASGEAPQAANYSSEKARG